MACGPTQFTQLNGLGLSNTLGRKLIGTVDRLRDLSARYGFRPYEVRVIRTRWTGGERGLGQESVVFDEPILPTPLISSLDGVRRVVNLVGLDELGTISLSQVSGRYAEGYLTGTDAEGYGLDADTDFFFEVVFPTPGSASDHAPRRRFFPVSAPSYDAGRFEWTVTLQRSHVDRQADGRPY